MSMTKTKPKTSKSRKPAEVVHSSPEWTSRKQKLLDESVARNEEALRRLAKL